MPDLNKMDRTWLCSVLFMDIVGYSSRSVELQIKLKQRFNQYLTDALLDVPEGERVILDTGDGAAVCFLGAPEAAMFTAFRLWQAFVEDTQREDPGLLVRLGVNLGPVRLVKDINGALNAIGDGMNAAQRVMSFASENHILVSQSYFEVVSRLSDDYKNLFRLKGIETDKHIREHTVYHLLPPGSATVAEAVTQRPASPAGTAAPPPPSVATRPASRRRAVSLAAGGIALAALAAAGYVRFYSSSQVPAVVISTAAPQPAARPATVPPSPDPPKSPVSADTPARIAKAPLEPAAVEKRPADTAPERPPRPAPVSANAQSQPQPPLPSQSAAAEYNEGKRLIDDGKAAEAIPHFDNALAAGPDYIEALVGRAEARRMLAQYDLSIEDCNRIIKIRKDEPRGYSCRGLADQFLKRYEAALPDFSEAVRLKPDFAAAWINRGSANAGLRRYEDAVRDYNEAIRLRPRNAEFHLRRASAYSELKQYAGAIQDYTSVIRQEPNNIRAYRGRAAAEDALGDTAGAAADRLHVKESRKH